MTVNNEKKCAEQIAESYRPHTETKFERLQRLDRKAKRGATVFAYVFGTIGALVLGFGMCLAMKVLFDLMPLGIVIGVIGIAMVSVNYWIYKVLEKRGKNKYASEVFKLSGEILGENNYTHNQI